MLEQASRRLRHAAGNFYLNDKPTGAVVGQQPFGGSRASGTNDKAGSIWNLIRWTSPRSIKETLVPPDRPSSIRIWAERRRSTDLAVVIEGRFEQTLAAGQARELLGQSVHLRCRHHALE